MISIDNVDNLTSFLFIRSNFTKHGSPFKTIGDLYKYWALIDIISIDQLQNTLDNSRLYSLYYPNQ